MWMKCHWKVDKQYVFMYTNIVQHCNCQSQDNFSTLNITLKCFMEPSHVQNAIIIDIFISFILHETNHGQPTTKNEIVHIITSMIFLILYTPWIQLGCTEVTRNFCGFFFFHYNSTWPASVLWYTPLEIKENFLSYGLCYIFATKSEIEFGLLLACSSKTDYGNSTKFEVFDNYAQATNNKFQCLWGIL